MIGIGRLVVGRQMAIGAVRRNPGVAKSGAVPGSRRVAGLARRRVSQCLVIWGAGTLIVLQVAIRAVAENPGVAKTRVRPGNRVMA